LGAHLPNDRNGEEARRTIMMWTDFVVRGTLVLAAGFAVSLAFGRASAALRHFVWTAAFVSLLALPVALRLGPKVILAAWPAEPRAQAVGASVAARVPVEPPRTTPTLPTQRVPRRGSDWRI